MDATGGQEERALSSPLPIPATVCRPTRCPEFLCPSLPPRRTKATASGFGSAAVSSTGIAAILPCVRDSHRPALARYLHSSCPSMPHKPSEVAVSYSYSSSGNTMNGVLLRGKSSPAIEPAPTAATCHTGDFSSGIGFASNSFLHWRAVHRAQFFDFLRRALSVEIPVPAYICRYSFDRKMKPSLARKVGVHSDRFQIALHV